VGVSHGAAGISHVIVLQTLGGARRGRTSRLTRGRPVIADPGPEPVSVGRATVINAQRLADAPAAQEWLDEAGAAELDQALRALGRLLHAQRIAAADPTAPVVGRNRLLSARAGWGDGDAVAAGRWSAARDLRVSSGGDGGGGGGGAGYGRVRWGGAGRPRRRGSTAEVRLAALLAGRQPALACEELVLRARSDLDGDRPREAALQVLVALDAAIAELAVDAAETSLAARIVELRDRRQAIASAAQAALAGLPSAAQSADVAAAITGIEAALRARAAAGGRD
jgi:hypothetical protein